MSAQVNNRKIPLHAQNSAPHAKFQLVENRLKVRVKLAYVVGQTVGEKRLWTTTSASVGVLKNGQMQRSLITNTSS